MKIHDVKQGSEAWRALRLGIPTASEFHRIVTPGGKLATKSEGYMNELLAQWITGSELEDVETQWMQHGREYEPQAAASFEFETGLETETVGFITTDDGMIGASPDRLIKGGKRGVELKCPSPPIHVGYMRTKQIDEKYKPQVQGQMLVVELEAVYMQSYCPGLPTVIVEVHRDEKYVALLQMALNQFVSDMLQARADLERRFGPFVRIEQSQKYSKISQPVPEFYEYLGRLKGE